MDETRRKDLIRRTVLARRTALPAGERDEAARAIEASVLSLPEVQGAEAVLAFVSVRSEVPTRSLIEALLARGTALLLPFVAEDGAMRAAAVKSLDDLAPGYKGIPEPRARLPVDASMAGAIISPGVAFDVAGGRLGYGGGFYDAFLAAVPGPPRIGICFERQIVDAVPMAEHDQRMDVVVTEERVIRTRARGG